MSRQRLVVILHSKPLNAPSFNVVLQGGYQDTLFSCPDEALSWHHQQVDTVLRPSQANSGRDISKATNEEEFQGTRRKGAQKWQFEE